MLHFQFLFMWYLQVLSQKMKMDTNKNVLFKKQAAVIKNIYFSFLSWLSLPWCSSSSKVTKWMHQLTTKSDTLINQVQFVLIQTSTSIMKHVCFSVTFCLKTRPTLYRIKYDCFFNNVQIDKMKKCEDRAKPPIYPFSEAYLSCQRTRGEVQPGPTITHSHSHP